VPWSQAGADTHGGDPGAGAPGKKKKKKKSSPCNFNFLSQMLIYHVPRPGKRFTEEDYISKLRL
jgi:hypothetical protein